jgi:hypothetical protein
MSLIDDLLACTPPDPPSDPMLLVERAEEMIRARARVLVRHFEGRCDLSGNITELNAREQRWDDALRRARAAVELPERRT